MRPSALPFRVAALVAVILCSLPSPASAQYRAELEVERRQRTLSRIELYDGLLPFLRAERELEEDRPLTRASLRLPASLVGLDGYAALIFGQRPDSTAWGVAFELGRGVPMLGGSVERGGDRFTGLYLKLRQPNAEIAAGGGDHNGDLIGHGALYLKGMRWSVAVGGAKGPNGVDFQHAAATWHPVERGGAPGARFISERRSADRWSGELMFTDRANFNHFATWGQFGIAEFPHRKTFEAADDITRYVRPPIFLHGYTTGALAASVRYQRTLDVYELTLDARVFPVRALRGPAAPAGDERGGIGGYFTERVLPSLMVGAFRRMKAESTTWVGEIGFPPFSVFTEVPMQDGAPTYLFVSYRQGL
jgi:hypothetical protein